MGRTGGEKTKKKILEAAEELFAEKGYDGTGIQDIATGAGVNKALIYYHFKNKQDIVDSLFRQTINEMFAMQGSADRTVEEALKKEGETRNRIAGIVTFLEKKKKILSVMLMESLKVETDGYRSLFECAKMIIEKNITTAIDTAPDGADDEEYRGRLLMHEFFTGFLPMVFFALFKDKWAEFFGCSRDESMRLFSEVFLTSHIRHIKE